MIFPAKAVKDSWLAGTAGVQQEDEEAFILDQPVAETWAEVAALIAEAEAAERRARALPVMAAFLRGVRGEKVVPGAASGATYEGCIWTREGAVCEAAAILDAIERREGA